MRENDRRRFLTLTGTIGLTTFAGCLGGRANQSNDISNGTESPGDDNYLGTLAKGGPGEFSESEDVHSGWVHTVADGETYDVTFDVRICHQDEVEVEFYKRESDKYTLSFSTDGGTPSKSDCDFGTQITGSGSIPTDFGSLNVDVNGETLRRIKREGTLPSLHPLPDPIDAR